MYEPSPQGKPVTCEGKPRTLRLLFTFATVARVYVCRDVRSQSTLRIPPTTEAHATLWGAEIERQKAQIYDSTRSKLGGKSLTAAVL